MKYKRIISGVLALIFLLSIPLTALADSNVDTGEGGSRDAVHGFYRSSEWLYKISLYVGLSDKADTYTPISGYKLIGKPVYVRPPFPMPSNVAFTEYNKIQYLNQAPLKPADSIIEIIHPNVPRIPINHKGSLSRVKNFFEDNDTINLILERITRHYGTTKAGLVSNIDFTIANQTGKFLPEDILPSKGEDGRYQNLVPWVIIYEPVTIAHLRDGKTRKIGRAHV